MIYLITPVIKRFWWPNPYVRWLWKDVVIGYVYLTDDYPKEP